MGNSHSSYYEIYYSDSEGKDTYTYYSSKHFHVKDWSAFTLMHIYKKPTSGSVVCTNPQNKLM